MGFFYDEYENANEQIIAVDKWIDENYGFFSYFGIRDLVRSAMDNNLLAEYPKCPFTAGQIIAWAKWNDNDSILITAGGQAIDGQETWHSIVGTPEINPETGLKNSREDIDGAVVSVVKSTSSNLAKVTLGLGVLFLFMQYASAKATKAGFK